MTYSYTQLSQYLTCPRRYRYRYLDGWKEKDTRAAYAVRKGFRECSGCFFRREDSAAALFREWAIFQDAGLQYSNGDTWDRMLQQGIQLLDRFAQDDRVRIRQPHRNLQVKFTRPVSPTNDFVAYVDALGKAGRERVPAGMENHFQSISGRTRRSTCARSSACLLLLDHWHLRGCSGRLRAQEADRSSVPDHHHHRRTAQGVWPPR